MPSFLVLFFLVYALWQLYFYIKLRRAISLSTTQTVIIIMLLLLLPVAPILVRIAEQAGLNGLARPLAFGSYLWLAFIFLFVVTGVIFDACQLGLTMLSPWLPSFSTLPRATPKAGLLTPAALAITLCLYGFFEALQIQTETIVITTPKLPATHSPIRIAQVSDIHLGLIVGRSRLANILTAVKQAQPDILVSTGDLVDGQPDGMDTLALMLADIHPRYGKYAVTGNHEFYAGLANALAFTERAGFTLLPGKAIRLDGLLTIVGVNDRGHGTPGTDQALPSVEKKLLAGQDPSLFTLLLKHRPEISPDTQGLFDLQLSGHTHKDQIFPFSLLTRLIFVTDAGLLALDHHSQLYVSRGSGTWGPPIRLLSPPEITVIELRHDPTSDLAHRTRALDSGLKEK